MVRRRAKNGSHYHEPPYTEEEEFQLYKASALRDGATILRGSIMWTTRLDWSGTHWVVTLSRDAVLVATLTLDEWAKLSATKYLIDERVAQ